MISVTMTNAPVTTDTTHTTAPPFADVRTEGDSTHIRLPVRAARWLKRTMAFTAAGFFVGFVPLIVLIVRAARHQPSAAHVAAIVTIGLLLLAMGFVLLVYTAVINVMHEIVMDGAQRRLRVRDQFSFYTIPLDEILATLVVQK